MTSLEKNVTAWAWIVSLKRVARVGPSLADKIS